MGTVLICAVALMAQTKPVEHTVRWMENIYTIARKYKTEPQIILDYNRLTVNQIRRGVVLLIPVGEEEANQVQQRDTLVVDRLIDVVTPFNPNDCLHYRPYPGITHSVSLILPLQLRDEQPDSHFLEFYAGFLLAVEDLKEEGMGVRLSSYDLASYPDMRALVQSGAFRNEELIIGPVYAHDVFALLRESAGLNAKIVSPLDRRTETAAEIDPRFFQVNPSLYSLQYHLLQYVQPEEGAVWLFSEEGNRDDELLVITRQLLAQRNIPFKEVTHKIVKDQNITDQLMGLLTPHSNNQIIVASHNEAFVSDLLRNLNIVHTLYQRTVTLFGNAWWRDFENVDLEYYHRMHLHLSVSNYIDYGRYDVKHFLSRYRALNRTEPSAYAFRGYDVGYYFLRALYTKGPSFEHCIEQGVVPAQPLQSNFRFQKTNPNGGFINTDARIIRYLPDYRIEVLH